MENKLSESLSNYLEIIYEEELKSSFKVQPNTIAEKLSVTRAAVTKATEKLASNGYIIKVHYGDVTLTDLGREIAKASNERTKTIYNFLKNLGVNENDAIAQSRKLAYVLKDEIYLKLKDSLETNSQKTPTNL